MLRVRSSIVLRTLVACGCLAARVSAQGLLSEPVVFGGGRVTLGGNVTWTASCANTTAPGVCDADTGFFNYSDYEHSTLRMLRLGLIGSVKANERVAFLGEIRTENGGLPQPYALYVRVRPWKGRAIDVQAGRVPPTFGAFPRRSYASDNLLIGHPLGYQYLSSLRPDALPATTDELLQMRGRGWLSSFSVGNKAPDRGLPVATTFRWDTGVQVHSSSEKADATVAVTTGSLGNPLVRDDNGGKQLAGRLALHPVPGLHLGASAARGAYLTHDLQLTAGLHNTDRFLQSALGADAEYSRDYYLVRTEAIFSRWTLPTIDPPLDALAILVEGRYKIRPGLYVAARADHLGFSEIAGTLRTATWDAPVTRFEIGGGYLLRRNLQLKLAWQHDQRDGGRVRQLNLTALELGYWF